ncbi:MAG: hypothetical protein AB7V13_22600 [Pseudorhodoplanes sp.]|uniref:hypothetical protein n=1 Tax=Pseudorhodoplanes sp. TaxID=1934341 RepID=UPI003D09F5A0
MTVNADAQTKSGTDGDKPDGVPEVPGDDIFGFTSATDVGNKGDLGFADELNGFEGKRTGSYNVLSNKAELGYTFAENWWMAGSAFVANHRIRGVTELDDRSSTAFEGLTFELKHRLVERSATNPFAVTLSFEPYRAWIDLTSGKRTDGYGAAVKILVDAALVPDRVYWAANAIWVGQRQQLIEDRSTWVESSGSWLSTALSFQLSKNLFVGAELRQLMAYAGTRFNERVGYAYYLGPTLLWKITDKIAFNATWQPQISGRSIDNPDLRYDLDNFDRAQFRFKLAVGLN